MISLSHLNKLTLLIIFFIVLTFDSVFAEEEAAEIWSEKEPENEQSSETNQEKNIIIKTPILSDDIEKITIQINEQEVNSNPAIIGIFDPDDNNFSLGMWIESDGEDIKNILKRINKLKLSKLSENLLFQVLFTNAYPPKTNLTSREFLEIKSKKRNIKFISQEILPSIKKLSVIFEAKSQEIKAKRRLARINLVLEI